LLWVLPLLIILLDFTTKRLAVLYLQHMCEAPCLYPYGGIGVFENFLGIEFSLSLMTNKGAAWGLGGEYQVPLLLIRIGVVIGLVIYLLWKRPPIKQQIGFMLVIGGAIGNIADYFLYGHVIDMFHFVLWGYDYPVFNVADISIFLGIIWLIGISVL
jgi:signal peptidase II